MNLPHTGSGAGPNPGTCPLLSGLLQLAVGRGPHVWHLNTCNLSRMLQPTWFSTFPSSLMSPHTPLASIRILHPLQDHGAYLRSSKRNYPSLPSGCAQTLHPTPSTLFCHLRSLGPPTPSGGQLPLSPVQAFLCPGTPNGGTSFLMKLGQQSLTLLTLLIAMLLRKSVLSMPVIYGWPT